MSALTPAARLASAISEYAIAVHGRAPRQATMQIDLGSDGSAQVIVNEHLFGAAGPIKDDSELNAMDEAILVVINSLSSNQRLTADEIARRAGYSAGSGTVKKRLSRLADLGLIESTARGYKKIADETDEITS